ILKYAVLGEHKSSKIKVHGFLRKSSKLNIECQRKLKHKRIRKDRCKKLRKKNKGKNCDQDLSKDKRKHKIKVKKKDSKSTDKDGEKDGVQTPPVLLPAVLSDEDDSSREPISASEQDLLPPPLLQALVVDCIESKMKSQDTEDEELSDKEISLDTNCEPEESVCMEPVPETKENNSIEDESKSNELPTPEEEEVDELKSLGSSSPNNTVDLSDKIEETTPEVEDVDLPVNTTEESTVASTTEIDKAIAPLLDAIENEDKDLLSKEKSFLEESEKRRY
ncbi:uncharacterized protein TNCT_233621, partial [Trichonephila clavata]